MFLLYLRDMFQLILSPTHGWEDISYDSAEPRRLMTTGFLPWLLLAAATSFLQLAYDPTARLLQAIMTAIVTFLQYFLTYFLAGFAFSVFMPKLSARTAGEKRYHTFIMYSLGLLVLLTLVKHCLPMDLAILNFFPLYVILIMWRGARYAKVTDVAVIPFIGLTVFTIIIPPILISLFFKLIIP